METKIGWIGIGVIGGACAARLLDAGYSLEVFSRTKSKASKLLDKGAIWRESAGEIARSCDVVFSTVGYPSDVKEIFFGVNGILKAWKDNDKDSTKTYVDMTTSSPDLAELLGFSSSHMGFDVLDAPVSGGDVGARNGTLSIMVGGKREVFERVEPILKRLGTNIRLCGPHGAGQRTKATNQILIAGNMIGVCEALLYAYKMGLDLENTLSLVSSGAAGSWSLSNLAPRIMSGDFQPGFYVEHFVKDMRIALDDAEKAGLSLPGLALVKQLYVALMAQGGRKLGTQALIQALARLSNVQAFGVDAVAERGGFSSNEL